MQKEWLKRVLIPCWIIDILASILMFVIACFVLGRMSLTRISNSNVSNATGGLLVAFTVTTVGLVIFEIVQLARERLGPAFHLCSALLKLLIWIVYLLVAMIGAAYSTQESTSVMSLSVTLILIVTNLAQLIYGSVVLHRHRLDKQNSKTQSDIDEGGTISARSSVSRRKSSEHRDMLSRTREPGVRDLHHSNSLVRSQQPHDRSVDRTPVELDGAQVIELDSEKPILELPSSDRERTVWEKA